MKRFCTCSLVALAAAAIVFGLLYAAWALYIAKIPIDWGYIVEARFEKMPPNDKALIEWLRAQPGVVPIAVAVGRFEGGKLLYISFIQTRRADGQPPFPDLNGNIGRLGYTGSDGPFRDAADRSRVIKMH